MTHLVSNRDVQPTVTWVGMEEDPPAPNEHSSSWFLGCQFPMVTPSHYHQAKLLPDFQKWWDNKCLLSSQKKKKTSFLKEQGNSESSPSQVYCMGPHAITQIPLLLMAICELGRGVSYTGTGLSMFFYSTWSRQTPKAHTEVIWPCQGAHEQWLTEEWLTDHLFHVWCA